MAPPSDDDLRASIPLPATQSNSKHKSGFAVPADDGTIVLMVSEATSEGSQRLSIETVTSFEDTLKLIHETIGCVSVVQKPTLAYKLSTANQKSASINLRTNQDWEGLVTDVKAKMKTKKDVSVVISVFPDNYMLSLRAMTKKKKPAVTKKSGKMAIMDLNNDDSAGEDDDDEGVADGEKKAMTELDAEYRKCMCCGPTVVCKIDRSGEHVHLSFNQRCAWAVSLACGTNHVTKTTPPQGNLFSMFHRKAKDEPTPGPAAPGQYNPYFPYPMPPLFGIPHQASKDINPIHRPLGLFRPDRRSIQCCQVIHQMTMFHIHQLSTSSQDSSVQFPNGKGFAW
ncbi:hypothetical protein MVEN_00861400 [Mycena venus]|uniref:Uncharacterized protein n=1 Tax=Mycena venus TaxID=2733690 RepID=A0A8H6YEA5_9AGAR|nr:hypothetical protein MVEN_00861400 [Mycena venus]